MAKISDGASQSIAEMHEYNGRRKGDYEAARNQAADAIYKKDLSNVGMPIMGMFGFFFWLVSFDTTPSPSAIGLLFLLSIGTYLAALVVGSIITGMILGFRLIRNWRRHQQHDRILNLFVDQRTHLLHYSYGGDRWYIPYTKVLHTEVKDWAKESGVRMDVLLTKDDLSLVWFAKPEYAVAFKMRWY